MKLHFNVDWLRNQIDKDIDVDSDAGIPVRASGALRTFSEKKIKANDRAPEVKSAVLNVLVHQLRRRNQLTIQQLADKIRVEASEIEAIESDASYMPKPRTIHVLADYMSVPPKTLLSLTSEGFQNDPNLTDAALKFAASSSDLSTLSGTERKGLNDFVKFLSKHTIGSKADVR
jgi:transcriptional regulator with XRE-family HTH domain